MYSFDLCFRVDIYRNVIYSLLGYIMILHQYDLTHWGRVTHICVSKLTIMGSDSSLSPGLPAPSHYLNQWWNIVNWTLIKSTNFSEILIVIYTSTFKKLQFTMSSGKWRPFCLVLNVLSLKRTQLTLRLDWFKLWLGVEHNHTEWCLSLLFCNFYFHNTFSFHSFSFPFERQPAR